MGIRQAKSGSLRDKTFLPGAPRLAGYEGRGAGQGRGAAGPRRGGGGGPYLRPMVAQAAENLSVQISSTV